MKKSLLAIAAMAAWLTLQPAAAQTAGDAPVTAAGDTPEAASEVASEVASDAAPDALMLAEAQETYATICATCHGRTGRGMASFPRLSGKTAEYLADRLTTYRAGEQVGPNSMLMYPNAADLSDTEIETLAAFMAETFR